MPTATLELAPCPVPLLRAADLPHPERAISRGSVVRVGRGVYAPWESWHALTPWDAYLTRVHAVAARDGGVVFSHESAAALLGMGVLGDPRVVHILLPGGSRSREAGGIRTHTTDVQRDIIEVDGILMTSPCDTAVTLARHRHPAAALGAADAALRVAPWLSVADLIEDNESRISSRGRRVARWAIDRATPLAETMLESVNRAVIEWLGFPAPVLQRLFETEGWTDRTDFLWEESLLVGEVDGMLKYDGRFGDPVAVLQRRGDRDARLLSRHVRAVAHWGWRETVSVDPVRAILVGHGLRPQRPAATAELHTLRRLLSPSVAR